MVVVDGRVADCSVVDPVVLAAYDAKYDWSYDVGQYGPLTAIAPDRIHSWHAAGWGGRDGVVNGAAFEFEPLDPPPS